MAAKAAYLIKFTPGYVLATSFLHGNVQRKALASRQDICNCDKLTDLLWFFFNNGKLPGTISGNRKASFIILGKRSLKKNSVSSLDKIYK